MKKIAKIGIGIILFLVVLVIVGVIYLTIREYKPEDEEKVSVPKGNENISLDQEITLMTYNIGYGCLSATEDFFMDGGKSVRPESKSIVEANLGGIAETMKEYPADIYLLQEVDINSKRSYQINQREYLENATQMNSVFAYNFNSAYVPYPIPTIGHVESGVTTLTNYNVSDATRISLPIPFKWPVRTCNLKRCLLESRFPITDSENELVVINLHLEAYDDGEGKKAQTELLMRRIEEEYQKGNYVIAGGDFNQTFEQMQDTYPIHNTEHFVPGVIGEGDLPKGFRFAIDDTYPTSRLLDQPYLGNSDSSQYYVIDGFIVSDNIEVQNVSVINTAFTYADHEPVTLSLKLKSLN